MPVSEEPPFAGKLLGRVTVRLGSGPVIAAVLLLLWEIVIWVLQVRSSALPAPSRVLLEIWREAPQLRNHAWVTGLESLEGLLFAGAAGFLLAILNGWSTRARGVAVPVLSFLQKLPLLVLAPLVVLWLGLGAAPAAAVSFLVCFPFLAAYLQAGFDSVPVDIVEILQTMGAGPLRIFLKVHLPACVPYMTRAVKLSVTLALAGAMVTEWVGSDNGLGYLMLYAGAKADSAQLFAALTVVVLMALGAYYAICLIERAWISWPAPVPPWIDLVRQNSLKGFSLNRRV
ncbi:MAG: ABC transporter permease subunit [Acidobacteriia bacterium]|nr:ABC transporter permease subunit [Terriglobia bacterium]